MLLFFCLLSVPLHRPFPGYKILPLEPLYMATFGRITPLDCFKVIFSMMSKRKPYFTVNAINSRLLQHASQCGLAGASLLCLLICSFPSMLYQSESHAQKDGRGQPSSRTSGIYLTLQIRHIFKAHPKVKFKWIAAAQPRFWHCVARPNRMRSASHLCPDFPLAKCHKLSNNHHPSAYPLYPQLSVGTTKIKPASQTA